MSEKKSSWLSRLFGSDKKVEEVSKKSEEITQEIVTESEVATDEKVEAVIKEVVEASSDEEDHLKEQEAISEIETENVVESLALEIIEEKIEQGEFLESVAEVIDELHETEEKIAEIIESNHVAHIEDAKSKASSKGITEKLHDVEDQVNDAIVETADVSSDVESIIEEVPQNTLAESVKDVVETSNELIEQGEFLESVEGELDSAETEMPVAEALVQEAVQEESVIEDESREALSTETTEELAQETVPEKVVAITEEAQAVEQVEEIQETEKSAFSEVQEKPKTGFFARLKERLGKTRDGLTEGLADLFVGKKHIDDDILEELETRLLMADVGVEVTQKLIGRITEEVSRKSLSNVNELLAVLNKEMIKILEPVEQPLIIDNDEHKTYVLLMVGVNGVGKTTTIGKLAKKFQAEGKSVMLAAGDTFRAAAVDQLKVWGERNNIPVIAQKEGADPASVIFDAMESARARKVDVLIADTAGRLHTQAGLMQELAKIHRVMKRVDETAPHEVMLVVDASTGQNALNQATQFNEIVPLSGITFTKLDGTAKGGIIFAIADKLQIPVRFIGVGEAIDDLRSFDAQGFVSAIVDQANNQN